MPPDFSAVAAVLHTYFDGLYHGDTRRLAQVFHADARYVCATQIPVINLGMGEYFPLVDARPTPASRGEVRADAIDQIQFAGPATAFARVRCAIGERQFTDFLTLIFDQGRWQIIAKVFHYDIKGAA